MRTQQIQNEVRRVMNFSIGSSILSGELVIPREAKGLVLFSHGSGSSRFSTRNNFVANFLNGHGYGTFLFDLLTPEEDRSRKKRFDIELLTDRLIQFTQQMTQKHKDYSFAYFGSSTGAASALKAAACLPQVIKAVVCRGGRPDLAREALPDVRAAVLLIVGSLDDTVVKLNSEAFDHLQTVKKLEVIEGASHLFEEPGKLFKVVNLSIDWFNRYLG